MGRILRFLLAGGLGLIAALWTWTLPGDAASLAGSANGVTVHVLNNGFHTDIAVPRAALEAQDGPLAEASRSIGEGDWVLIGWGDAKFFVDTSPMEDRIPDGLRAFFWFGNASVVMLDPETGDPSLRFPPAARRTLRLTPEGFTRLTRRVEGSLALIEGRPRLSTARDGNGAHFFASREHFWIGHLCNHWTAGVLQAAGVAVRPLRSVTAGEVMKASDVKEPGPMQSRPAT